MTPVVFLAVAGLVVLAAAGWWVYRRSQTGRGPQAAPHTATELRPVTAGEGQSPPLVVWPTRWNVPEELAAFQRVDAFELSAQAQQALQARLRQMPKPPQGMERMLSADFLAHATADTLSELILAEPHVAAKVLATVNSPFYGLPKPVASVSQGIALLGLDTVRGICLQYLLSESLRPDDPRLAAAFDRWWHASAIASHLCLKLGQRVGVPDPGSTVTLVVLSFLGHMAALSLLPLEDALRQTSLGLLDRTRVEQERLGLCAGELGCLLMTEWDMPATIVEDVRQIDRVLTTAPKQLDAEQGLRTALSYYCARVGEKLASGEWSDLEPAIPEALTGADFFHLQTHFMIRPRMTQLAVDFREPAFVQDVARMVREVRAAA